ncbi:MAG: protein adenylyltransferase Fic [Pyrinomonadaceae bacterium]
MFNPRQPYNALPGLPPRIEIETKPVLKVCVEARAALAALQQAEGLIPNPAVLINTIPLLEAQASSEIENIVTTADALFRYAQTGETADPATKEALRYRTALNRGFETLKTRPLSVATAVEVCSTIKGIEMDIRRVPGTVLQNAKGEVVYTPPAGESLIRNKLANWERFIHNQTDIDPLIRMAIAHYQFEAIHPFSDGNGRTGRILNLLMLIDQGLLKIPVLYLSQFIIRQRADYYHLLSAVTRNEQWEPWVVYMLRAVHNTATWTTAKIQGVRDLLTHTLEYVRAKAPAIYTREVVELIFIQPYCRIQNFVSAGIGHRQTASNHLKRLCEIGVLKEIKAGREKLFIHPKYLKLLLSDEHTFAPYSDVRPLEKSKTRR